MLKRGQVWIGLVGLTPKSKNNLLKGARGAYVNILAWVTNASDYRAEVKRALDKHGFRLEKTRDVEPLAERLKGYKVPQSILHLAQKVKRDKGTHFGEFYVYPNQ